MAKKKTKKKKTKNKTKSLVKKEYTDEEKVRIAKYEQLADRKPVNYEIVKGDSSGITVKRQNLDDLLHDVKRSEALGTADTCLQNHLLEQIIQTFKGIVSKDTIDKEASVIAINKTMSILSGIQPQDELEAMLAAQMIGVHNIAMRTMGLAILGGQTFEGKQANVNYATKMLRTFMAQIETLKRYRTGGQQKMIVEHVHVNEGGQAIVGTVNQGGGGNNKNHE